MVVVDSRVAVLEKMQVAYEARLLVSERCYQKRWQRDARKRLIQAVKCFGSEEKELRDGLAKIGDRLVFRSEDRNKERGRLCSCVVGKLP